MIIYTLTGLFVFSVVVQLFYYFGLYWRFVAYKRAPGRNKYPVSVIICARNEADNLKRNLPSILEQDHEDFEVIVVNDCSTDDSEDVLGEFMKKYNNLRVTTITPDEKFTHGKKLAITVGIKASKHEWLVFTDADCKAGSKNWLARMQENFSEGTEIVLGYGKYESSGGLLNAYIRYDTVIIAMQYFSYALAKKPYMGVGRNLAYRKSLFFRNKGFASNYGLESGDDDLFVNETANKKNTAIEFHPESHTVSIPKTNRKEWFRQKKRHLTTAKLYKPTHLFLLGFEPWARLLFYMTFAFLVSLGIYLPYVLAVFTLRLIIQLIIFKASLKQLNEKKLWLWIIPFDLFSMFINFNVILANAFTSKKSRWK